MTADLLLQAIAEQYFPRIDTPSGTELTVEDAAGDTYTLRFRWAVSVTVTHCSWCGCYGGFSLCLRGPCRPAECVLQALNLPTTNFVS
jgi:hypothetical protein